jgi:hypothetical protein
LREQERIRLEQERLRREQERMKQEQLEQLKLEEQQRDLGLARLGALGTVIFLTDPVRFIWLVVKSHINFMRLRSKIVYVSCLYQMKLEKRYGFHF